MINTNDSILDDVKCGSNATSLYIKTFLSLIYVNNLHPAIKYSKTPHFADGTNVLNFPYN